MIAGNLAAGIGVFGGSANSIALNSFFANAGIDLGGDGPTANDPGDGDTGPNSLQNFPVLSAPTVVKGKTTIPGTLDSAPGSYTIVFYASPSSDSPAQGRSVLGSAKAKIPAAGGVASFALALKTAPAAGTKITAVAVSKSGDTSELSAPVTA